MNQPQCRHCSEPDLGEHLTLWDGRLYCRTCIEQASPALLALAESGAPLEETLDRHQISTMRSFNHLSLRMALGGLLFAGILLGVSWPLGKVSRLIVAAGPVPLVTFCLMCFTMTYLLGVLTSRAQLPRTVSLSRGLLTNKSPQVEVSFNLRDCKWRLGKSAHDMVWCFTTSHDGVVIQTPSLIIVCGQTEVSLLHWRAFLKLARVANYPKVGWLRSVAITTLGAAVGIAVGAGVGFLVTVVTGMPNWSSRIGVLGAIDGALIGNVVVSWNLLGFQATQSRLQPASMAFSFFVAGLIICGVTVGAVSGGAAAIVCALVNGLLGYLFGRSCQNKLRAEQLVQDLANETGQEEN